MPTEVVSLQEFLEVVRKSDWIKLDNVSLKLLNSTWMYVTVHEIQWVEELHSLSELLHNIEDLIIGELSFAESFVLSDIWGCFHFHVDISFINYLMSIYIGYVVVLHLTQKVNNRYSFSSLLLVEGCYVYACNHLQGLVLTVKICKNFPISLFKIDNFTNIFIGRRIAKWRLLLSLWIIILSLLIGLLRHILGIYGVCGVHIYFALLGIDIPIIWSCLVSVEVIWYSNLLKVRWALHKNIEIILLIFF